jgi:hypothetical protein
MVITSCNTPKDEAKSIEKLTQLNIDLFLRKNQGLDIASQETFHFDTVDSKGAPFEFWLAGWRVLPELN